LSPRRLAWRAVNETGRLGKTMAADEQKEKKRKEIKGDAIRRRTMRCKKISNWGFIPASTRWLQSSLCVAM